MRGSLIAAIVLAGTVVGPVFAGGVAERIHQGVSAYQRGHYGAAASAFESALKREPASPESAFDLGTAEYRDGKYSEALKSFQKAEAANAASPELQARASYDQGKSLAKLGDAQAAKNPRGAVGDYKKGVEAFTRTLQVDPSMKKAGYNIEVLRRRIQKLEQELKRQPRSKNQQGSSRSSKQQKSTSPANKRAAQNGPRPGKNPQAAGTKPRSQGPRPSSGGKPESGTAQIGARQILNAEKDHRRIINLRTQQVSPHVAQNW